MAEPTGLEPATSRVTGERSKPTELRLRIDSAITIGALIAIGRGFNPSGLEPLLRSSSLAGSRRELLLRASKPPLRSGPSRPLA